MVDRHLSNLLPIIDTVCQFCQQQCFVPLTTQAPPEMALPFIIRKVNMMATCRQGQKFDKGLIGYCFDDILAEVPDYDISAVMNTITGVKLWRSSN